MNEETKEKTVNLEGLQAGVKQTFNKGFGNVATCTTAGATAAKTVTLGTTFELVTGATILVTFTNGITVDGATLAVTHTPIGGSSTTEAAKPIYYKGAALKANIVEAGVSLVLRYNGTQFDIVGQVMNESGEYKDLTAGNIVGTFSDNGVQFGFRPTAGAVDIESGKADNGAKITHIKGNTVVWNQLVQNGDFSDGTTNWTVQNGSNGTISAADGELTYTISKVAGNNYGNAIYQNIPFFVGHKYIVIYDIYVTKSTYVNIAYFGGVGERTNVNAGWNRLSAICTPQSDTDKRSFLGIGVNNNYEVGDYYKVRNAQFIDLTLIYGSGNEPSTVEAFEADYMKWFGKPLSYEAYDAGSLRPVMMSGIKTVGFNQWDEEVRLGYYNVYGNFSNADNQLCTKNKITIIPGTSYYINHLYNSELSYYDKNGFFIKRVDASNNSTFLTPANACYLNVNFKQSYGATYNHDICINLAHSGARNGEYEAHWDSLCSIPITSIKGKLNGAGRSVKVFPDGLKKAGTVYDEIVKRGEQTIGIKRIGSVDLGTINFSYNPGRYYFESPVLSFIKPQNNSLRSNAVIAVYDNIGASNIVVDSSFALSKIYSVTNGQQVYIRDLSYTDAATFKTAMDGVILYYELETPEEYVLDFTIPQVYDVDDYGTEEIVYPDGVQGTAPTLNIEYGINAPDTIKNLPKSYVSVIGEQEFNVGQKERARLNIGIDYSYARKTDFSLEDLHNAVAEGNLEKYGLKVGDQKTINGHTYVIAGLNPMKGTNTPYRVAENHVGLIVIPHTTTKWNASGNTYTGADSRGAGYKNSDLHYYLKNTVLPMCNTDLGANNLIGHSKLLTNAVNQDGYNKYGSATGCSSGWVWENNCMISALSEVQVYGSAVWSSSGYDTGEACRQLEVFQKYSHTEIFGGEYSWLRDVVSASIAALAAGNGLATNYPASDADYVAALILFK